MNRQHDAPNEGIDLDMEALLREEERAYAQLRRGEVVEGTVIGVDRDGIVVDVGSKSEGLIPPQEMQSLGAGGASQYKTGDPILVFIMTTETPEGQIHLSVDRARGERGWRLLQQYLDDGESFDAPIVGYNKGGLLASVEGVNAFIPLSQVVGVRAERDGESGQALAGAVGRNMRLKVIELNRRRNRVILSERAALQEWRTQQKDKLLAELKEGDIRPGKITSIRDFGVFIDLGGADGLAHLSELSWDRNKRPEDVYHVGDEVDAYVLKVDPETQKIALSLRRASPEKWEGMVDQYQSGDIVVGRITKLVPFGAFARLDGPVEGLVHISELVDRRITHPREIVHEGDVVPLKVVRIERERHRLALSLKQAVAEGERLGFVFNGDGSVREAPEELRERSGVVVRPGMALAATFDEKSDTASPAAPPAAEGSMAEAFLSAMAAAEGVATAGVAAEGLAEEEGAVATESVAPEHAATTGTEADSEPEADAGALADAAGEPPVGSGGGPDGSIESE